jgi:tRNA threonylcarbamoyladenosine biosynthesis protein TsaB
VILGIETATPSVSVALGGPDGVLAAWQLAAGQRHAETLVPAIQFLCRQAGVELARFDAVAVDVGPGLFTGLRVGVATAQALAQALDVPLVEGSSLELLAYPFRLWPGGAVASVVDARRAEVYFAVYRPEGGALEPLVPEQVGPPEAAAAALGGEGAPRLAVGDGALRYASTLERHGGLELAGRDAAYPQAAALVERCWPRFAAGQVVRPGSVRARYLRRADAVVNYEQREPAGTGPGA